MKFPLARMHRGVGDNNLRGYCKKENGLDQCCGNGSRQKRVFQEIRRNSEQVLSFRLGQSFQKLIEFTGIGKMRAKQVNERRF